MKKIISCILSSLLVFSTTFPALAQKTRFSPRRTVAESVPQAEARFATVNAYTDGKGIWIQWAMEVERNNLGFRLFRVTKSGEEVVPGVDFVLGSSFRARDRAIYGGEYNAFMAAGGYRSVYFIESTLSDGTTVRTPVFGVQFVADLTPYAGATSSELIARQSGATRLFETQKFGLPKDLRKEVESYSAEADPTTHRQVIAKPGVKITVKNEGVYRITKDQLQAAGFDVSTDPSLWQLYVEGVEQSMQIGPNGSYIEFYGIGADTLEVDYRVYFLVTGDAAGKRFATHFVRPAASTVYSPSYAQTSIKKERVQYVDSILNGEAENFFGTIVFTNPTSVSFNLSAVDFAAPTATVQLTVQGFSSGNHTWSVQLNGQPLTLPSWFGAARLTQTFTVPTSALLEGANRLDFQSSGSTDNGLFDNVAVSYSRKFSADQNRLTFFTDNYRNARVDGFTTQNVRVFDITDKNNPALVSNLGVFQNGSTYSVNLPASRARVYSAVEDSALLAPVSIVQNNPNIVADSPGADLLIISYKDFLPQAETWANYRRAQGLTVNVYDVGDIYDEFSYGALSWRAVKDFLAHAYGTWATRPKYVLLIGDGSFDPRNFLGRGFQDYIPVRIVNTVYTETASDDALADFDDDGNVEIAIGRIAAGNAQSVTNVFNKTMVWENSLTADPLSRGALFAYDDPIGWDFEATSKKIRDVLPATTPSVLVARGASGSGTTLLNEMNTGKYVVNYSGHGTASAWATLNPLFFNSGVIPNLTNSSAPSIYTSLSCLNGYFHNPTFNSSLAESLTNASNGGGVAVWASSGETTPDIQEVMALRFFSELGAGNNMRLGDLIKDSKLSLTGGLDVKLSWVLIGDPALKLKQ